MKRKDLRPAVFRTFRFDTLDESAAFLVRLAQVGAGHAHLIRAKLQDQQVRVRIAPDPVEGKAAAKRLMGQLLDTYHRSFRGPHLASAGREADLS